jgi:hypothetical protein
MGETSKKCEFYGHMVFDFARSNCKLTMLACWLSFGNFSLVRMDIHVPGGLIGGAGLA